MARIPTRKTLEGMKRADIQQLCKDHRVRANLKTEALIDLLLNSTKSALPKTVAATSSSRTVSAATGTSSRRTSGRSRGLSKGSVIIHDSEDEKQEEEATTVATEPDTIPETENEEPARSEAEPTPAPTPPPASRTRKAKDTQTRLGKGRPRLAGGTGARAVTTSVSASRSSNQGRNSRTSVKPTQQTILEEEPEPSSAAPSPHVEPSQPDASGSSHILPPATQFRPTEGSLASLEAIDKRVADALRPIHAQMSSLKVEVERLKTQVTEIPGLQLEVQNLTTEVEGLRSMQAAKTSGLESDMAKLKEDWTKRSQVQGSSTGAGTPGRYGSLAKPTGWSGPSAIVAAKPNANGRASNNSSGSQGTSTANMEPPHPGFAAAIIGKRRRDSDTSNITGVIEEGHQDEFSATELEKHVIRPDKKRAKLDNDGNSQEEGEASGSSQSVYNQNQGQPEGDQGSARASNFTVFSGVDEPDHYSGYIDPPPPTNHLPDFFAPSPDHADGNVGTQTSTAHATENNNIFGFGFLPMGSTPMHPMYPLTIPNFPYPEVPTSPSPAGAERAFQPFGMPARPRSGTSRPRSRQEGNGNGTINPATLSGHQQDSSSNDIAAGGLTTIPGRMGESTAAAAGPAKKTMYGTELEGDTRFGDFGIEGVATGFWAGGRF